MTKVVWRGALAVVLGLAAGCGEQEPDPPPKEERVAPIDPDRFELGEPGAAFEAAFPGWSWATLDAERQAAVRAGIAGITQPGPPAWVSLRRTRGVALDAIRAGEVFGEETLAIVAGDLAAYRGEGLSLSEQEGLVAAARQVVSDRLGRLRFRELKDGEERARKAAASLGVSPSTQALAEFSELFQAPLVLSMSIELRFQPSQEPELTGTLTGVGRAHVFHRSSDTILASVQVESREPAPLREGTSLVGAGQDVARALGAALADQAASRLFERFYASK